MRRYKNLYGEIVSFQNLLKASKLAQRGKRFKNSTAQFNFKLERELWQLHHELLEKRYQPGNYYDFTIYEPKERVISAAPYRDRVVHHAVHNILEPVFEPTFICDSYATRKGKGVHAAIDQFQTFAKRNKYVLKCDVQKYFPNIDHEVLMKLIKRKIACPKTLWLIEKILDSHQNMAGGLHPVGIPIGNLTSQFFANIYLNGMDHYIKEKLRCRYYLRYMDDFVIFHRDKQFLWDVKQRIEKYLGELHLRLHEGKCRIFNAKRGVPFLGMVIFPGRRRLKRENVVRFKRRLRQFQELHNSGSLNWAHIRQSIQSWLGYAEHADTSRLRGLILNDIIF